MKIYEIYSEGEKTWIYAKNKVNAKRIYESHFEDISSIDTITVLPKEKWCTHKVIDLDIEDDKGVPFSDWVTKFPEEDFIACTVY